MDPKAGDVDKEKVILSYLSVQSFAVAARGRVFLLDTYIYRVSSQPAYVPTTVQELVDLRPEAIFLGHGHGVGAGTPVKCTSLTTLGSTPGAEVSDIRIMRPDICITAFKHLHSGAAPFDPAVPVVPINPVRDPRVESLYPPGPPPTINTRTNALNGGPVSMLYQFSVGDFSLVWHDTNGPIKAFQPQLIPMLAALPKADVELGSLVSIGETVNGTYDIALYLQLVKPKIFYGGHADNFSIGASPYYHRALRAQLTAFGVPDDARPEIVGWDDPYDYLTPGLATFAWKDPRWREVPAGKVGKRCEGAS